MSQREDRLRAEARARMNRQADLIRQGKVKVPSNAEALGDIASGMRTFGQDAAAALAAVANDPDAGKERLRTAERDGMPEELTGMEKLEADVDRALNDPKFEASLTPHQRMVVGRRLKEREYEAQVRAADEEAEAMASGDA